jgi:tetrahydromethanopterin S-methyltransferase subunit F
MHDTSVVVTALRQYIVREWQRLYAGLDAEKYAGLAAKAKTKVLLFRRLVKAWAAANPAVATVAETIDPRTPTQRFVDDVVWQRRHPRVGSMAPGPGDVDENKLPQKFAEAALPQFSGSVSQQCNGYDCGPYMILFMRKFLLAMSTQPSYAEIFAALNGESLPEGSSLPQGFLRKNWVTAEEAALQRPRITLLILEHLRDALLQTRATTEKGMTYEDQLESIRAVIEEVREQAKDPTRVVSTAAGNMNVRCEKGLKRGLQGAGSRHGVTKRTKEVTAVEKDELDVEAGHIAKGKSIIDYSSRC